MKIPAILNTQLYVNNRYNSRTQQSKKSVSFNAVDIGKLKKMPLENKLTHLFTTISSKDLVVIGKNMQEIQQGLKKTIASYENIIKRILVIFHGGIAVPLAFTHDSPDSPIMCTNIGENPILRSSYDDTDQIEPSDTFAIGDGDVLINKKVNIPIETVADFSDYVGHSDDFDIVMNPENYATSVLDFSNEEDIWVKKANKFIISRIDKKEEELEAKKATKASKKLTFNDVGGMDKTIETLKRSILFPIKFPFAFNNISVNKGFLLHGKPGTGKTLLAEALAGECDAHFIKLCGTDLESKWVGETEENWRKTFAEAREKQPSIIFIDEFDAIVKERGGENSIHGDKTVNQILSLMSDIEKSDDNIFVIATTNKPETIDSAMLRSGRFGKQIEVLPPDRKGLEAIFDIHIRNKSLDESLNKKQLLDIFFARGFTGADIKYVVNEAHTNSWVRSGIYKKMEDGSLTPEDMLEAKIKKEDFDMVLKEMDRNRKSKERKPIGFN